MELTLGKGMDSSLPCGHPDEVNDKSQLDDGMHAWGMGMHASHPDRETHSVFDHVLDCLQGNERQPLSLKCASPAGPRNGRKRLIG